MVFAVVVLVFVGFAIAITIRPVNIIALSVSVYAFEQWAQANSGYFARNAAIINYAFGALCLYSIFCATLKGRNPLNPITPAMWTWFALFSFAAVSCLWSIDRDLSLFLFKYNLPYVVTFVGLMPFVMQDREDLNKAMLLSLLFGTLVMILLLADTRLHAWGRTIEVDAGAAVVDRVGKSRKRLAPLAIGELGGQMLILAVLLNFRGMNKIWQHSRWLIGVIALALIFRSQSRGQLFGALLSVLALVMFSRGTKRAIGWVTASVSACLLLGMTAWAFVGFANHQGSRWDLTKMQSSFSNTRLQFCAVLLDFWAESSPMNWIFGLGSSASYDVRILGRYCHVTVVEVLAELGFVGITLLALFALLVGRDIVRLYRLTVDSDVDRGSTVALCGLFLYAIILSFKQGSFLTNTNLFCFGLLISRQAAIMRVAVQRDQARDMRRRWAAYYARLSQSYGQTSPQS